MKKELSTEQVNFLFDFVKSKYVKYIDVQHEIVDHLASAIEDEMEMDQKLDFNQALRKVYSRFPITGFVHFISEKEKAHSRYWLKRIGSYFLSYMKIPKIFLLVGICYLNYALFQIDLPYVLPCIVLAYLLFTFYTIYKTKQFFKANNFYSDDYLVVKVFRNLVGNIGFPPLWFLIITDNSNLFQGQLTSPYSIILFSIMLGFMAIWNLACLTDFPRMLVNEIELKYNHLNIA